MNCRWYRGDLHFQKLMFFLHLFYSSSTLQLIFDFNWCFFCFCLPSSSRPIVQFYLGLVDLYIVACLAWSAAAAEERERETERERRRTETRVQCLQIRIGRLFIYKLSTWYYVRKEWYVCAILLLSLVQRYNKVSWISSIAISEVQFNLFRSWKTPSEMHFQSTSRRRWLITCSQRVVGRKFFNFQFVSISEDWISSIDLELGRWVV